MSQAVIFYRRNRQRILGGISVGCGIALATYVGVEGSHKAPPTGSALAAILAVAALFQIMGGAAFGRIGHVDEQKAKSAVRTLVLLGLNTASLAESLAGAAQGDDSEHLVRAALATAGQLALMGSFLENATQDWNDVHPEALVDVLADRATIGQLQGRGKL